MPYFPTPERSGLRADVAMLPQLPADTWTNFPQFDTVTKLWDWRIYDATGKEQTFSYRFSDGQMQLRSNTTYSLLLFNVLGT